MVNPLGNISTRFDNAAQIAPGVTALVTPGHSAGRTSYIVTTSRGRRIIAFGDVLHIPAQFAHPRWASAPDTDANGVANARAQILNELETPSTIGFGIHFGDQPFGTVTHNPAGESVWGSVATRAVLPAPHP